MFVLSLSFFLVNFVAFTAAVDQRHLEFLENNPYVPPIVDNELGFSRGRSPCPGLNTLANHGFINRDGTDITFRSVAEAAKISFGIDAPVVHGISMAALLNGIETKSVRSPDGRTELAFDLFGLYTNNVFESYGRAYRQDDYFEDFPQFNETIFNDLVASAKDGILATADILEHRLARIRQSRSTNPEATFDLHGDSSFYARSATLDLLFISIVASVGNVPDLTSVSVESFRQFAQENRFPDNFTPLPERGLPLVSQEVVDHAPIAQDVFRRVQLAIEIPLIAETQKPWFNPLYFALCTVVPLVILVCVAYAKFCPRRNASDSRRRMAESENPASVSHQSSNSDTKWQLAPEVWDTEVLPDPKHPTLHHEKPDGDALPDRKQLSWHDVTVSVPSKSAPDGRQEILSGVSGCATAGQLTGILGHSGSGKSTLLGIIGGRHSFSKSAGAALTGGVKINGRDSTQKSLLMNKINGVAFVEQDDFSLQAVTPREAIRFSARLRLPLNVGEEAVSSLTAEILRALKLTHVQDRIVSKANALSGGEKRRVSLGVELVTSPQILLLDEITSGLDSHSAFVVMDICRQIAKEQKTTVVMVIHQPNSSLFSLIDHVVLMNGGKSMYHGPANEIDRYFADRGFPIPSHYSTADWILDVSQESSHDELLQSGFFEEVEEMGPIDDTLMHTELTEGKHAAEDKGRRVSFVREIVELFRREYLVLLRDPAHLLTEVGMIFGLSLLNGVVFAGVGHNFLDDPQDYASHLGVVFTTTFACAILSMMSITSSIKNRSRFCREYVSGHYRLFSYGIVMMFFELLFVLVCGTVYSLTLYWVVRFNADFQSFVGIIIAYSCVCSGLGFAFTSLFDVAADAQTQVPLVIAPQFLLSGFIVTQQSLAPWIRWMVWFQPLTYSYRLMLSKELSMCQELTNQQRLHLNCAKAIEAGLKNVDRGHPEEIYDDNSVLTLTQSGQYKGRRHILEYFGFASVDQAPLSLLWDHCQLHNSDVATINEVGDGFCDVTIASAYETRFNRNFRSGRIEEDNSMTQFVTGRRIELEYPEDLSSFTVKTENVFMPQGLFDIGYGRSRSQSVSSSVCGVLESSCSAEYDENGFTDIIECVENMELLPLIEPNSGGLSTVDSNSTSCRQFHSSMAVLSPDLHCPHMSFVSILDVNGEAKCSKSSDYAFDDYFSGEDFVLFQRAAQMNGIDHTTFLKQSAPKGRCAATTISSAAIQQVGDLPEYMHCYDYLQTHQASDDDGLIPVYWISLAGFLVFYCLGGLFLLRRRALCRYGSNGT